MAIYLLFIICLLGYTPCYAQFPENHLIKKFTQNQGLTSYNIRCIIKDPLGFTWIATQEGLSLYDGQSFTKYTNNSERKKRIFGSDVRCITLDTAHHMLWVLTEENAINAINYQTDEVEKTIVGNKINNDDWSSSMVLYNNRLWISCMSGIKVFNILNEKWETSPPIPFKKNKNNDIYSARTIYVDTRGYIWTFIDHYGIIVFDTKTKALIKTIHNEEIVPRNKADDLAFTSAYSLSADKLIIGTSAGLRIIEYNKKLETKIEWRLGPQIMPLMTSGIKAISQSSKLFYIANNKSLYKISSTFTQCTEIKESNKTDNENWLSDINSLYVDDDSNLWIGCKQGLAFLSSKPSPFYSFSNTFFNLPGLKHVYNVFPSDERNIIVGGEQGLSIFNSATKKFTPINNSKPFNFSFKDFKNRTIVSADDGLYILNKDRLRPISATYPELKTISDHFINSFVKLNDSVYVIGSDNQRGIYIWNIKEKTIRIINNSSYPIKLRSNIVSRIFKDSQGRVWVLSDFGIDIIAGDFAKIKYINIKNPKSGEPLKLFFDICEVNRKFWITSYSCGIVETDFNGKALRVLNTNNGLCNDGVYKIFNTKNKRLIVTSNNGLSVFNLTTSTFTNYYEKDGLHSNAFEENCGTEKNGKIYVGGLNGFTIVDPALLFINKAAPKLYFTDIKIDAKSGNTTNKNLVIKNITVPEDALQTSISFIGLNYGNPDRVQYKYKIEELNDKWINLGTQNFVNIIGINPGTYNLLVESANENGVWNQEPIRLTLLFLPKWYETWWFKITVLTFGITVISAFYQYRIKQIKIQQQIRRDIANDLHDDLGSNLNSIKIFTHLAIEKKQNTSYLNEIEKLITSTAVGLRDMLWVLEDSQDDINGLADRIKKFAIPLAHANQINFECQLEQDLGSQNISKTEKRNLLLIAKEAINNCFKYAECQTIKILVKKGSNNKISLFISDDGVGFNITDEPKGYGLNNMKYRAEQINYSIHYNSSPGNGTVITVEKK